MRFAREPDPNSMGSQIVSDGVLADRKRDEIPRRAVAEHRASSIERHPGRTANWRLNIGPIKTHAVRGKLVNVRGLEMRVTVTGKIVPPELVAHNEQNISDHHFSFQSLDTRAGTLDAGHGKQYRSVVRLAR
jgi:hypothetical protein